MLLAASTVVPLFASRGALAYTPYLIVTTARGFVALVSRDVRWLAIGLVLAVVHPFSVYHVHQRPGSTRDYKALAGELAPRLKESDLIFVKGRSWQTTPIFYYLKADRYRFVGKNYSEEIVTRPDARVWAVVWGGLEMPPAMIDALENYRRGDEIKVRGARAVLYTAPANKSIVSGASATDRASHGLAGGKSTVLNAPQNLPARASRSDASSSDGTHLSSIRDE